jgi:hypothetical protein
MRARLVLATLAAACLSAPVVMRAQSPQDPEAVLDRIARHVLDYYSRAQSLMSRETVDVQAINPDFSMIGTATRYAYQLRLEWTPPENGEAPQATMIRELLTVNGRKPRPKDEPKCTQPRETWTEPLGMFLPDGRREYDFKWSGAGRMDGRATVSLDFRSKPVEDEEPETTWGKSGEDACLSLTIPGRMKGRVWADAETGEVLRLDQTVPGLIEVKVPSEQQQFWHAPWLVMERSDTSIRYKRVRFEDPDEELMLPTSIQSLTMWRGGGSRPLRKTQTFKDYRRFLTGGRLIE